MDAGTITEAQFLLTELQYTLGQLHVQLADMDPDTRAATMCGDRSIEQVLSDLLTSESEYQAQYARLLGLDLPAQQDIDHIALPVDDDIEQPGSQTTFEHMRTQTIELLRRAGDNWSQEVLDLVKRQVSEDRTQTTQIAECRKQLFEEDSRPDLEEPLTTTPAPHELSEDSASDTSQAGNPAAAYSQE
ncbi:MAG TPA: hypothetical protein VF221_03100 [Chloroflexota bacterium]